MSTDATWRLLILITKIRVDPNSDDGIQSTTLYRPQTVQLNDDDKENLKLLNVFDPYFHEFFFGGRIIVVEGDTEYTAYSFLKMLYPTEYDDIHVIKVRGKNIDLAHFNVHLDICGEKNRTTIVF